MNYYRDNEIEATWHEASYSNQIEVNKALRRQFIASGDDGTAPRDVRHFIYRPVDGRASISPSTMRKLLRPFGFQVEITVCSTGLRLSHDREIASENFDVLTVELGQLVEANGWEYDGWEARVLPKYAMFQPVQTHPVQ